MSKSAELNPLPAVRDNFSEQERLNRVDIFVENQPIIEHQHNRHRRDDCQAEVQLDLDFDGHFQIT